MCLIPAHGTLPINNALFPLDWSRRQQSGIIGLLNEKEAKMIQVSELAGIALVESLRASGVSPDQGFRLRQEENQFSLEIGSPAENDRVIKRDETIMLIVDRGVENQLGDTLIDVEDSPEGPQLVLRSKPSQE